MSFYPLVMTVADSDTAPFLSTSAYLAAHTATQIAAGWAVGGIGETRLQVSAIKPGGSKGWKVHWPMLIIPFTVLFFVLSVRWTQSPVIAAIIVEAWPLVFAPLVVYLTRHQGWKWKTATVKMWSGMLAGCVGMGMVLSAQGLNAPGGAAASVMGGAAALAAAACTSCLAFGHRWAEDICSQNGQSASSKDRALLHAQAMCYRSSCVFWAPPCLALAGILAGETGRLETGNVVLLLTAGAITACSKPLTALSVAMEDNLGGFSLIFLQPVMSLMWLLAASETGNVNWMLIVSGGSLMMWGIWSSMR